MASPMIRAKCACVLFLIMSTSRVSVLKMKIAPTFWSATYKLFLESTAMP